MFKKINTTEIKQIHAHETKQHAARKFLFIFFIFFLYCAFIISQYGIKQGLSVTFLTWSFFVLCTPVADAGFLIDFPLRIITNLRMIVIEIIVWLVAILITLYCYFFNLSLFSKTKLLSLFEHILSHPFPFWSIIIISSIGTFVSIRFGDELFDKISHNERFIYHKHKQKHHFVIMIFLCALTFILYDFLLKKLGVHLPF